MKKVSYRKRAAFLADGAVGRRDDPRDHRGDHRAARHGFERHGQAEGQRAQQGHDQRRRRTLVHRKRHLAGEQPVGHRRRHQLLPGWHSDQSRSTALPTRSMRRRTACNSASNEGPLVGPIAATHHDQAWHGEREARRAMTLLELTAVVVIVGLLGVMAVTRYGSTTMADVGAKALPGDWLSIARTPAGGQSPRATTICCGSRFSGGNATQYALYRRQGASTTLVDEVATVPAGVTVTTGGPPTWNSHSRARHWLRTRSRCRPRTARGPSPCRRSPARRSCSSRSALPT